MNVNHRGIPYVNPWHTEEEIMSDKQTVLYIFLNFGLAVLLVTAVNTNNSNAVCATKLK